MSDQGKQILESTRNFREYLENVGKLLSTAGDMLEKHGYETGNKTGKNKACGGVSTSIKRPNYWILQDAFRFLTHKNGRILVVISVILDDIENPDALEQPLVSAAWFKYGKEVGDWEWEFSRIILSVQEYSLDGKMMDVPPDTEIIVAEQIIADYKILSSRVLAVPLVDIQSERDIEEKIITPLVQSLSGISHR